jgi:hypothetical protein
MKAGNAHQMGISQMNKAKVQPFFIVRAISSRKILPVNLKGKSIQGGNGSNKIRRQRSSPFSVPDT